MINLLTAKPGYIFSTYKDGIFVEYLGYDNDGRSDIYTFKFRSIPGGVERWYTHDGHLDANCDSDWDIKEVVFSQPNTFDFESCNIGDQFLDYGENVVTLVYIGDPESSTPYVVENANKELILYNKVGYTFMKYPSILKKYGT